jgi:hypothetical protein
LLKSPIFFPLASLAHYPQKDIGRSTAASSRQPELTRFQHASILKAPTHITSWNKMNLENAITEIEWLERLYLLLDTRPLQLSDRCAANQRHDEMYANNPWFRLWKRYGI